MRSKIKYLLLIMLAFMFGISSAYAEEYSKDEIDNKTHIIGNHAFTAQMPLTTKSIMLAAKTIEGNTIDDMIIYYKNAKGKWTDALTGDEITVPATFEIRYVDMEDTIHVATPTLHNITEDNWAAQHPGVDYEPDLEAGGVYVYEFGVDPSIYSGNDPESDEDYYFELYETSNNQTVSLLTASIDSTRTVSVKLGESKTYTARVYIMVGDEKVYSEPSNQIPINHSEIPIPVLHNITLDNWSANHEEEYIADLIDGVYEYDLGIDPSPYRTVYDPSIPGSGEVPEGFTVELYEISNNQTTFLHTIALDGTSVISIKPGENKNYSARVCVSIDNNKVCSNDSNIVNIDKSTITTPIGITNISIAEWQNTYAELPYVPTLENGAYVYEYRVTSDFPQVNTDPDAETGYYVVLYKLVDDEMVKVNAAPIPIENNFQVPLEIGKLDKFGVQIIAVGANGSSSESAIARYDEGTITIKAPTLHNKTEEDFLAENPEGTFTPTLIDDHYVYDLSIDASDYKWIDEAGSDRYYFEIYERIDNEDEDNLLNEEEIELGETNVFQVEVGYGEAKKFLAKVYAYDKEGKKVYSDESNKIIIDTR